MRINSVSKSYDNGVTWVVKDVTLEIKEGETLILLGSSGSGKTTLVKMLNRLVLPTSGSIEINNRNIEDYDPVLLRRSMGYVFQAIGLFPHMNVQDNIGIVLKLTKIPFKIRRQRAYELLELSGLNPKIYAKRYPAELSGGQQQRVGVARALAANPRYLLMDEPFSALDAISRSELQQQILELKKELKKTIVFVTHDIFEALLLGDRLVVMHNGKAEQIGTPKELIQNPATDFVNQLFQNTKDQIRIFEDYF